MSPQPSPPAPCCLNLRLLVVLLCALLGTQGFQCCRKRLSVPGGRWGSAGSSG